MVLLYMRTLESTLKLRLEAGPPARPGAGDWSPGSIPGKAAPSAFMPEANDLAERFAAKVGGVTDLHGSPRLLLGVPLHGPHPRRLLPMGADAIRGRDRRPDHAVHGYDGLYVIDGSAMSANPGVNPSLTITAMAERAMSLIPAKSA